VFHWSRRAEMPPVLRKDGERVIFCSSPPLAVIDVLAGLKLPPMRWPARRAPWPRLVMMFTRAMASSRRPCFAARGGFDPLDVVYGQVGEVKRAGAAGIVERKRRAGLGVCRVPRGEDGSESPARLTYTPPSWPEALPHGVLAVRGFAPGDELSELLL